MASKAQRAVTGVPPERWAQFGKALQEWREDELGYQVRGKFAEDRFINLRLVQDLEKNYRPGTFTKWALQDAAQAYKVPYSPEDGPGSVLAFLRGETDTLARAEDVPAEPPPAAADPLGLPPSPFGDPVQTAADRPYALAIWKRFLDLPRRVTEPSGAQMFPGDPDDEKAWDGIGARLPLDDRVWFIADLRRRADRRDGSSGASAAGA
ncbi:MAG TPA: hypothetical protein VFQ68_42160 [Streptosporangiaceae bacterium]|nr:hypothetical protein [Streptosporangiaceae bacterium]